MEAAFDAGRVTSDGGLALLRELTQRSGVFRQFAACFTDTRDPSLIEHTVEELLTQRVLGIICGYEDLNDHERLRDDALLPRWSAGQRGAELGMEAAPLLRHVEDMAGRVRLASQFAVHECVAGYPDADCRAIGRLDHAGPSATGTAPAQWSTYRAVSSRGGGATRLHEPSQPAHSSALRC